MMNLFPEEKGRIVMNLPDAEIEYFPNFYNTSEADNLFKLLMNEIPWQQDYIKVFGKEYLQPRLTSFFGNENNPYTYSNITMYPHPWTELLHKIKEKVEIQTQNKFTSVLLNLYRDGRDSNGWHADNEKELGINPVIASLSFGATRIFQFRHNTIKDEKYSIPLENGSLLLMKGTTQHYWKHQIPKTAKPINPRINLTFRTLLQPNL